MEIKRETDFENSKKPEVADEKVASQLWYILNGSNFISDDLILIREEFLPFIEKLKDIFGDKFIDEIYFAWKFIILTRAPKYSLKLLGIKEINTWFVLNLGIRDTILLETEELINELSKNFNKADLGRSYLDKIDELEEKYRIIVDFVSFLSLKDIHVWEVIYREDPFLLSLEGLRVAILNRDFGLLKRLHVFLQGLKSGYDLSDIVEIFGDFGELEKAIFSSKINFFKLADYLKIGIVGEEEVFGYLVALLENLKKKTALLFNKAQMPLSKGDEQYEIIIDGRARINFFVTNVLEVFLIIDYIQEQLLPLLNLKNFDGGLELKKLLYELKALYFKLIFRDLKRKNFSSGNLEYFSWVPIRGIAISAIEVVNVVLSYVEKDKNKDKIFDMVQYILEKAIFPRFSFLEFMEVEEISLIEQLIDLLGGDYSIGGSNYIREGVSFMISRLYEPYYDFDGNISFKVNGKAREYLPLVKRMIEFLSKYKFLDSNGFEFEINLLKKALNDISEV